MSAEELKTPRIAVSGITIEWRPEQGTCTFEGAPVAMMWIDSTLKGLLAGIQVMVGTPRFELALQSEGRRSVAQDWQVISKCEEFEAGFRAIAEIAAVAGWGRWELLAIDHAARECRFRATSSWESRFQQATGLTCDSSMVAGKFAGYCSKLFGVNCWADQTAFGARGDPHDEFHVHPSDRVLEEEIRRVTRDITEREVAAAAVEYETRLRRVLGDIANSFINLVPGDLDRGIVDAIEKIARFVDADRSYVLLFDLAGGTFTNSHEWCKEGIEPQIDRGQDAPIEAFSWILESLLEQRTFAIPAVSELPPELAEARAVLEAQGVQSLLIAPLISGGDCIGALGFDFVNRDRSFSTNETRLLQLTGATISQALGRRRSEEARAELEAQLRQAQKMEAVGRLAGGVAHDFNNMLCAISGSAELLLDAMPAVDPSRELIEEISTAAERATDLTRQLLAFSRKQVTEPRVIDLSQVVKQLHPMLVRLLGEDVALRTAAQQDLWSIRADINLVEQVVVNLAVNARDAMPTGGALVIETMNLTLDQAYCERQVGVTPGSYVALKVSDTGCGMEPAVRDRIFEPFFTTKELGQGTGLGLATVEGIVEQSGGKIEVCSEPGHGTSFKVYFPRVDGRAVPLSARAETAPVGGEEIVLLVEDEEVVRAAAEKMLARLGYTVLVAATGQEAVALADRYGDAIDLLLTDVVMPGMNGRELTDQLTAKLPGLKVLFASGYTESAIAHHGVLDEGVQLVTKPYTLKTLAYQVRTALAGQAEPSRE